MHKMKLTDKQLKRYARNIALGEVGVGGQLKLLESRVLIIGVGGLGSPVAMYLAAAGVGTIGIVDADCVDLTNLQRQVIHRTQDVGVAKVESAKSAMRSINPDVEVHSYSVRLDASNAVEIVRDYQFVIDATDNFASKFMIADVCHFENKPYSHAGILEFSGQTMTVIPGKSACYRCVFGEPPQETAGPAAGVIGALPGIIGSIQAAEAIKCLLGIGELLTDRLLIYDALKMSFREVGLQKNPRCTLCGDKAEI
jgi:molybdopterin/thiamine biosynthesis adenylyltransferase